MGERVDVRDVVLRVSQECDAAGVSRLERVVRALFVCAEAKNTTALRLVLERVWPVELRLEEESGAGWDVDGGEGEIGMEEVGEVLRVLGEAVGGREEGEG